MSGRFGGGHRRLLVIGALAPLCLWCADPPGTPLYQVPFPAPPADGTQALKSLPDRSRIVLSFLACGNEAQFFDNGNTSVGEGAVSFVIAKLVWSSTRPNFDG